MVDSPTFVISLDFELGWGVEASRALGDYRANIAGARRAIPRILALAERYDVRCTWATVGLLFFEEKEELLAHLPERRAAFTQPALSAYARIEDLGPNEQADPLHFGLSLIREIRACPAQEIAGHTFSHYACLEDGDDPASFRADLVAAKQAAARLGLTLASLVFPRNQVRPSYLALCREAGYRSFRGVARSWLYRARPRGAEARWLRAMRLADSYLPLSHQSTAIEPARIDGLLDIPASLFLRPATPRFEGASWMHIDRILGEMNRAARIGALFHLWWHPENFGLDTDLNLAGLEVIFSHYRRLSETHGMRSRTMAELAGQAAAPA